MKLHIIIPNYNGAHFLTNCLNSLRRQTYQNFRITVVDNGSSDESVTLLQRHYPEVNILKLPYNKGFAAAANVGIQESKEPYVMLLNNDTIVKHNCIEKMMNAILSDNRIFSVGAHILSMNAPHLTDTIGDFYTLFGYAFCRGQGLASARFALHHKNHIPSFTNCGCAVIYRRSLLEKTGLFDEHFFAYLEDVDLGFRARKMGYKNVVCPEAHIFHYGSGTTGAKYTPFKVYLSARNNIWLRKKNLTLFQRLFRAPFFLTGTLLKLLYFHKINLGRFYTKGILDGTKTSRHLTSHISGNTLSYLRTESWTIYGSILYAFQFLQRHL